MLRISMVSDIGMQMVEIVYWSPTLDQNFKMSNQKYYKNLYTIILVELYAKVSSKQRLQRDHPIMYHLIKRSN